MKWDKLLCEDLLYIERYKLTTENKLKKKNKLDLVSAHIQLAEATGSISTGKDTSGSELSVSSSEGSEESEAREYCVLQEVWSDTYDNDNIPSQNWPPTVGVTVIAMYR